MPIVTIFDLFDQTKFMNYRILFVVAIAALATACEREPETSLAERAQQIAINSIIIDTHIDVPYRH